MKNKLLGYIFIAAVFAAIVSAVYFLSVYSSIPQDFFLPSHHVQKTAVYTNPQYVFQFNYGKNNVLDTSGNQSNFFKNPATSIVSASVPRSEFPKTNFGSAIFTVAVQTKSQEASCLVAPKTQEINGTIFHVSEQDGAAAGTRYKTKVYRVFRNQHCFELSETIGIANIDNFEPGAVTEVDENNIWDRLDQMLKTFKFNDLQAADSDTVFCGGIASIPCPLSGYVCEKEGVFPDAGTICKKGTRVVTGILTGHVTVGPNCPVERVDQPCPATPQVYMARQVGVFSQDTNKLITSQHLDGNGNYQFSLGPGTYTVKASGMVVNQLSVVEGTVTIKAGKTTTLNFDIDTGIR